MTVSFKKTFIRILSIRDCIDKNYNQELIKFCPSPIVLARYQLGVEQQRQALEPPEARVEARML